MKIVDGADDPITGHLRSYNYIGVPREKGTIAMRDHFKLEPSWIERCAAQMLEHKWQCRLSTYLQLVPQFA